jgi:hypothetical protein
LEARIQLFYKTIREAEAIAKAVSPENATVPRGLFIKTVRRGSKVFTRLVCENKLETFTATIEDLLSAVSVAEKSLSAVKDY